MSAHDTTPTKEADDTPLAALHGSTVLLVEDEAIIAVDIEIALQDAGANVLGPGRTLADALTLARNTPDITGAILDINLHGESVVQLADHLAERSVPIVFHTGFELVAGLQERYPDAEFLTKPVLLTNLLERLAKRIE